MEITKTTLLEFGMKMNSEPESFIYPMEKVISIDNKDGEGTIKLAITRMRNRDELCLCLPDGAMIYICPKTIEELGVFEKCIAAWEPVY